MSGLDGLGWPTDDNDDDDFLYGVGEGSHIDRVPLPGKVRNQTTVSDQPQDSNDRFRLGWSFWKKFKMIFTNNHKIVN